MDLKRTESESIAGPAALNGQEKDFEAREDVSQSSDSMVRIRATRN